jgi:hypothetical protein
MLYTSSWSGTGAPRAKDTSAWYWYAGTRARVEAWVAQEQAEELRRALEDLGRELRGEVP